MSTDAEVDDVLGPSQSGAKSPVLPSRDAPRMLLPAPDRTAAAFFDVDGTTVRGASIFYFAWGLTVQRLFRATDLAKLAWSQLAFLVRGVEDAGHIDAAQEAALAFIAGQPVGKMLAYGEVIYDKHIEDKIWPGTRELMNAHLAAGQRVYPATSAPVEIARIFSRRLGLTDALGTEAEIVNGVYTGRLVGGLLHGPAKAAAIRRLADREGLDLARCSAYSDSVNDLPMLELVGHPHVVNPDPKLHRIALERNWPVHEFRTSRKAVGEIRTARDATIAAARPAIRAALPTIKSGADAAAHPIRRRRRGAASRQKSSQARVRQLTRG